MIEPDDKHDDDGSFTLYFDDVDDPIFWNPSNTDTDTTELRNINVRFESADQHLPAKQRMAEPVLVPDFGFVGDDDFDVDIDDLRIETKSDLIGVLLHRLNEQRQEKKRK